MTSSPASQLFSVPTVHTFLDRLRCMFPFAFSCSCLFLLRMCLVIFCAKVRTGTKHYNTVNWAGIIKRICNISIEQDVENRGWAVSILPVHWIGAFLGTSSPPYFVLVVERGTGTVRWRDRNKIQPPAVSSWGLSLLWRHQYCACYYYADATAVVP